MSYIPPRRGVDLWRNVPMLTCWQMADHARIRSRIGPRGAGGAQNMLHYGSNSRKMTIHFFVDIIPFRGFWLKHML